MNTLKNTTPAKKKMQFFIPNLELVVVIFVIEMVRLRYSAVVKLVALFFFALFIVPSLLKLFNAPSLPLDEDGDRLPGVQPEEGAGDAPQPPEVVLAGKGYDRSSWAEVIKFFLDIRT